ncbi:helix-turn-helix domain-containing protein [Algoriphagus halophilus]|uniref:Helix-turn-helix domain-containing protein n=1 Tax=Algoriphagus halophilus TaxID=226505 RepID=A0A1N6G992_9BACT|nr:helix-turn-helix domain-containing protein [Algoriphagus halophilus]SIO04064.1 Helix-turn-helix domain-containing protein [Algoriphagus halophilus]
METIVTLIIWAAVIQGFLLGVIFITSKKHSSLANRLLGWFLIAFVFQALTDILPYGELGSYSISGYFTLPEVKWLLPLLFLHFVLEKVGRFEAYQWFLRVHYFLAFAMIGLTLVNVLLVLFSDTTLVELVGSQMMDSFYMSFQYYAFILTIAAFVIAFHETRRYHKRIKNEISDLTLLNLNWLYQFIFLLIPIILFWGAELARIVLGGTGQSDLTIVVFLCIAFFNYFVSYKAFTQQTLFDDSLNQLKDNPDNAPILQMSTVSTMDSNLFEKIESEMQENRYYLDQNLTIHDLAKHLKIPARTISTSVNQSAGCNFNEWINNYRVDHALATLQDKNMDHYSIEGIGRDSGFKSRSAMYLAFKNKTGHPPGYFK